MLRDAFFSAISISHRKQIVYPFDLQRDAPQLSPHSRRNSLFLKILSVSPYYRRFCGWPQTSDPPKPFGTRILPISRRINNFSTKCGPPPLPAHNAAPVFLPPPAPGRTMSPSLPLRRLHAEPPSFPLCDRHWTRGLARPPPPSVRADRENSAASRPRAARQKRRLLLGRNAPPVPHSRGRDLSEQRHRGLQSRARSPRHLRRLQLHRENGPAGSRGLSHLGIRCLERVPRPARRLHRID